MTTIQKRPAVALLPGLLCNADLWRDQIKLFQDLGYGTPFVPRFAEDQSISVMARRVTNAIEGPFICLGLSMGGYVALEVMRQAGDRVVGLGLFDTSAKADDTEKRRRRELLIKMAEVGKFNGVSDRLMPSLIHEDRLADEDLTRRVKAMALDIGRDGFFNQQKAILSRISSLETLPTIKVPTLVICGRQDALTPLEESQTIKDGIGDQAKLAVIENCGHLSTMEAPDTVNTEITAWLETL